MSDINGLSPAYQYHRYKVAVYDNLFTGVVYGAYIVVYATSVCVLLSKPGFTSSRPRMFMFGITTFMFALGIIALVLETTLLFEMWKLIFDPPSTNQDSYYTLCYRIWAIVTCLMYILCDSICAWRTVVLWNKDKRIIAILVFFNLATTATAGYALAVGLLQNQSPDYSDLSAGEGYLIVVVPTLATNLLSTGLISWKAWQRRISVKKHLCEGRGIVRVDRVFALLIESGLIYCCVWILYWISTSGALPDPGFTVIAFISGLYPTLIIILVSKQMSPVEHYSTHSPEMQYTRGPALGPPGAGGTSRHVLTFQREYTNDYDTQIPPTIFMKTSDEEQGLMQ